MYIVVYKTRYEDPPETHTYTSVVDTLKKAQEYCLGEEDSEVTEIYDIGSADNLVGREP